jgi:hypothetical protein
MPKTTSFELPSSYLDGGDCAQSKDLVASAQEHLDILERQALYFELKELLSTRMEGLVVQSFKFSTGSHYNDDGYSDHVALEATFMDTDGQVETMEADDEYGGYNDDRFEELHDLIESWPSKMTTTLENKLLKCANDADLGKSIMGPKGYALYEARCIERSAAEGASSTSGALRV